MSNEPVERELITERVRVRLDALAKANAAPRCGARSKRTGRIDVCSCIKSKSGPRSHRRCWPARPDLCERWPSRLVAAAAEDRLSFRTTRRSRPPRLPNNPAAGPRAFRSSRTDRGAQVLPPAGATVPPWLPAKSARLSSLLACCALSALRRARPLPARLACPLGSSPAAGSSVRPNQGVKARPHALNRFRLAHKSFIDHF